MSDSPFRGMEVLVSELLCEEVETMRNMIEQKDQTIKLLKQSLISRDKFMIREGVYDKYLGIEREQVK